MLSQIQDWVFLLNYKLRNQFLNFSWELKPGVYPSEFQKHIDGKILEEYFNKYPILKKLKGKVGEKCFCENVFYLNLLENFDFSLSSGKKILDVGSKNFSYLYALQLIFPGADISGIEVDTAIRYGDFHSRLDYVKYFQKLSQELEMGKVSHFISGNFLEYAFESQFDVVTSFFPFIFSDTQEKWRLPKRFLNPEKYFSKIGEVLKPGGILFSAHISEEEAEEVQKIVRKIGKIKLKEQKQILSPTVLRPSDTFVLIFVGDAQTTELGV